MLKFLIADDHEIVRKGIRQIILEEYPDARVEEAYDTPSLIRTALAASFDLIISDLAMPGGGGLEGLSKIRKQLSAQRILILSIYPEEQYAVRVLKLGASGFLNKNTAPEELVKATRTILGGRRYIQPSISGKLAGLLRTQAGVMAHELLSEQEYELFLKLASGRSSTELCEDMKLNMTGLNSMRTQLLQKMGFKSNADLIKYAQDHQMNDSLPAMP